MLLAKTQIRLRMRAVWSESSLSVWRTIRSIAAHSVVSKSSKLIAAKNHTSLCIHIVCLENFSWRSVDTVFTLCIRTPPYHICSKIWTSTIHYPMLCLKIAGWVANSIDTVETPRSAASLLGLNCLFRPVCPNTYDKYGSLWSNVYIVSRTAKTQNRLYIRTVW